MTFLSWAKLITSAICLTSFEPGVDAELVFVLDQVMVEADTERVVLEDEGGANLVFRETVSAAECRGG